MSALPSRWTKEDMLLLGVGLAAAAAAAFGVSRAAPPSPGLWLTTAAALALAQATIFALWFGRTGRRVVRDTLFGERDSARALLSALPEGMLVVADGRVCSVNRRFCEILGLERTEVLGAAAPYPFWPPEGRHHLEEWHRALETSGEHSGEVTLRHRNGERLTVLLAGRAIESDGDGRRYLLTVQDISLAGRRERRLVEIAARDPETGLLNRAEFEERLGDAVRRATAKGEKLTVVLAELAVDGRGGTGVFGRPEALVAVERLRALARPDDTIARTRDGEVGWVLPETDSHGGLGMIARARTELAGIVQEVSLTVGICDLAKADGALALYAFAGQALHEARARGTGATVEYVPPGARDRSGHRP